MANEAVIIELNSFSRPVIKTCASGTGISKGTLLYATDPNTVVASDTTADRPFAGIAAADKSATDGATTIAVYVRGQNNCFDLTSTAGGAAIPVGALVSLSGANLIAYAVEADIPLGKIIGWAEESTANPSASEVIRVRV